VFDTTVTQQGMDAVKKELYNPLKNLAFGGLLSGAGFIAAGNTEGIFVNTDFKGWVLKSKTFARQHFLTLALNTKQVNNFKEWQESLKEILYRAKDKNAFVKTQQWWQQFWSRSFIWLNKSDTASNEWEIGRNFQLFRYMLACNAHGEWPTKFNGGLFTTARLFSYDKKWRLGFAETTARFLFAYFKKCRATE
jgi:hypothetical protein